MKQVFMPSKNIFQDLVNDLDGDFIDRFCNDESNAVDVVIPVHNTNIFWRANLVSIYREIPVSRLIVGNGGCKDNTLEALEEFPRVQILDHTSFKTLGKSLASMFQEVQTDWFVYLHSDVHLPPGWFDHMSAHRDQYDWFECERRSLTLLDLYEKRQNKASRPYSGSQMGKSAVLKNVASKIEDDFLYRNEDLIIRWLVEETGSQYARITDTFHYHERINKPGLQEPDFENVVIKRTSDPDWEKDTYIKQFKGLIKYTEPDVNHLIQNAKDARAKLLSIDPNLDSDLKIFCKNNSPTWFSTIYKGSSQRANNVKKAFRLYKQATKILIKTIMGRN
jgi:hypothetical protein